MRKVTSLIDVRKTILPTPLGSILGNAENTIFGHENLQIAK